MARMRTRPLVRRQMDLESTGLSRPSGRWRKRRRAARAAAIRKKLPLAKPSSSARKSHGGDTDQCGSSQAFHGEFVNARKVRRSRLWPASIFSSHCWPLPPARILPVSIRGKNRTAKPKRIWIAGWSWHKHESCNRRKMSFDSLCG